MSIHWGGRGPGHMSRKTSAASGAGAPTFTVVNTLGTTVTEVTPGVWTAVCSGAQNTWGDASARSTEAMAGDFTLRITPQTTASEFVFGVDGDPETSLTPEMMDVLLYFNPSGVASLGSAEGPPSAAYTVGQHWFLRRVGDNLYVSYGGDDGITGATVIGTYTEVAGYPFYFNSALYNTAAGSAHVERLT